MPECFCTDANIFSYAISIHVRTIEALSPLLLQLLWKPRAVVEVDFLDEGAAEVIPVFRAEPRPHQIGDEGAAEEITVFRAEPRPHQIGDEGAAEEITVFRTEPRT